MRLHILTIVYNGMPFITCHLPVFNRLAGIDWHWHIVEGPADNTHCTSWCKKPPEMADGTKAYLHGIWIHPRVHIYQRPTPWDGKVSMVNEALKYMTEPGVLLEVDCDEIWTEKQILKIMALFRIMKTVNRMEFFCRYFVGQNIIAYGDDCYGNRKGEWRRAWRFTPGDTFQSHEPPVLNQQALGGVMDRTATSIEGLVFDHYAYAMPDQVRLKERYYGYTDAVKHWSRLQTNDKWPVRLGDFLPWVTDGAMAAPPEGSFETCSL